jgi:transposase-like protein
LDDGEHGRLSRVIRRGSSRLDRSAFAGFRFPPDVITVAVRWYLRYGLSYRDLEELLAERRIEVDHVTVYRWVQRFTPLFLAAARPFRHTPVTAGSSMRPTSRSPGGGATSTGRSSSSGR